MLPIAVLGESDHARIARLLRKRATLVPLEHAQAAIACTDAPAAEIIRAHENLIPVVSLTPQARTRVVPHPKDAVQEACRLGRNRVALQERLAKVGLTINIYHLKPPKYVFRGSGVEQVNVLPAGERAMDRASLLPVLALDIKSHERVLDLCAGPGNKSAFAASFNPELTSVEPHPHRMKKMRAFFRQRGIQAHIVQQDGRRIQGRYQKILVDAPCSGEGIVTKFDRVIDVSTSQVKRKAQLQLQLLTHAWTILEPGGRLVYATCALNTEENEDVVERFLKKHQARCVVYRPPFPVRATIGLGVRVLPGETRGLWYAVLEK